MISINGCGGVLKGRRVGCPGAIAWWPVADFLLTPLRVPARCWYSYRAPASRD